MMVNKAEDLEAQWYAEKESQAQKLDKQTSGLASMVMSISRLNYVNGQEEEYRQCMERLKELAAAGSAGIGRNGKGKGQGEGTAGLFEPLLATVRKLFTPYTAEVLAYIVEHCTEYPYSRGYLRRPFRTRNLELHSPQLLGKLSALIFMEQRGFVLDEYLQQKESSADYTATYRFAIVLSDIIAYELDLEDSKMPELLNDMVYGDNQGAVLSREIIKGVFMSHRKEAVVMLGELLLAAKLQEGLRQSLVELMDEGTLENNLYLLKLILEHNFIRYSSVVRALGVWTGMALEAQNQRVAGSLIEGAYLVLQDEAVRAEWLEDANAHHVYLSLWATAVHEEEELYGRVAALMNSGRLYQKIVAQYVLANSQNEELRLESARQALGEQDMELQYWVLANYGYGYSRLWRPEKDGPKLELRRSPQLEAKEERQRDFAAFKAMFLRAPHRELTGESKVLDFVQVNYTPDLPVRKMLYLTAYDMDSEWIAELIALKDGFTPDLRGELLSSFISDPLEPAQREFLFASLGDKSMKNRELAVEQAKALTLNAAELVQAEALLKLKTGSLRQNVTRLLLSQPDAALEGSIRRLLQEKNSLQRLAALEMVTVLFEDEERSSLYEVVCPLVGAIAEPAAKERELIAKLGQRNEYTAANGFGLFTPGETEAWLSVGPQPGDFSWDQVFRLQVEEIKTFLHGLDELVHEHREQEYVSEYYSGQKEALLLGASLRQLKWTVYNMRDHTAPLLELYPFHELWSAYLQGSGWTPSMLLELNFYAQLDDLDGTMEQYYRYYTGVMTYGELRKHKLMEGWRAEFIREVYPVQTIRAVAELFEGLRYRQQVQILIRAFYTDSARENSFSLAAGALNLLMAAMPEKRQEQEIAVLNLLAQPWLSMMRDRAERPEDFKELFRSFYTFDRMNPPGDSSSLELDDYLKAYEAGMIGEGELFKELLGSQDSRGHMYGLTGRSKEWVEGSEPLVGIRSRMIDRLLEIELARGELPTEVTRLTMGLQRIEGMDYFIRILTGLDKDTFVRGYVYGHGDSITKKESFSHLLKVSHPRAGEDAAKLKSLLKESGITEKRLLEAAMYAPQWIELVAGYLEWEGIRSAAWYFHAHINESFSAEKETIVAHYSPIPPQDFNDGAFDVNWFQSAYRTLGIERFDLLYDSAKYISAGSNHRRSQLFADATLGKLKLEEMKQSVEQKRNKDHLLSYSLIPLGKDREQDIRQRYELIQRFLAESKKFGAQRRASEGLAARIALGNLARNAGYADVTRLMWDVEARKLNELQSYFEPFALDDDTQAKLVIDGQGQSELVVTSKGKELKSVPARFKKHEHIEALKETRSELTAQFRRARQELERSMEAGSSFTPQEIAGLSRNPILAPLLLSLVLRNGSTLGFYAADFHALASPSGEQAAIGEQDELYIAHPLDLYNSGQWSLYQKELFDRQLRQPFKQVFRELYLPNADELANAVISRRYAGHQVQPRKTVALLRERQWTVSYEDGLQKVFYGENLIARLYAMADWFSPADTESPTLETVEFFDRTTYKNVKLDEVPARLFSEVMRDVDLVVSVAHVGGVDPEASLTTIEMRGVIVNESLRLLKLSNVRIEGNYAKIAGSLGEYAVHLGSGMSYKQASGALHIIPVHSQHRGRLFLPFLDEDPRTAEILSKVVLLAEDAKIKDPQILAQLRG